jgi:O-antigen ligase
LTTITHKTVIVIAAAILVSGSFTAAYFAQPALLLVPLCLLAGIYFLQFPQVLFYTLLASVPWSYEFNFNATLGTDLPDEPLMLLTAFASLALFISKKNRCPSQSFHPLLFLLVLQIAWLFITVAASTYPLFSIKYFVAKGWYLLAFVAAPVLLYRDKNFLRRAAIILFTSMFIVTLLCLYRHAQLGFTFSKVNEALRPYFRNHVNYSALLVFMLPLQIAFLQCTTGKWLRRALLLSVLIVLAALYFSYARGAWLALATGLLSYWLIKKKWLVVSFVLSIVFVVAVAGWLQHKANYLQFAPNHDRTIFHQNFSEHLAATYKGRDVSTAERFNRWVAGARMSNDKWLTGFGPTTFYQNYKSYTIPVFRTWVSDNKERSTVHNYFLLLLIEQGIMGLLLFLLLIGGMFWYAQKIYHRTQNKFWKTVVAAVAAILFMQCTVNFLSDLIETDKVGSVFYLCVAALVIADRKTMEYRTEEQGTDEWRSERQR